MRRGADVKVVMTSSAQHLVGPSLFEWATGNPVVRELTGRVEHIEMAGDWEGKVDLVLVAPCTANTIGKFANGIDDTPVTTILSCALGSSIPIVIAPAMHEPMMRNRFTQANVERLKKEGVEFVEARFEEGKAKIASVEEIVDKVVRRLAKRDMLGVKVLVTSGPTVEPIDPIRVITNRSSGRMGVALAEEAHRRGADVTLISGPGRVEPPSWMRVVKVETTRDMARAVEEHLKASKIDVVVMAAAPADYSPTESRAEKLSTRAAPKISLALKATPKIVNTIKKASPQTFLVAFKAEHGVSERELIRRARLLRRESRADIVAANLVGSDTGFGSEENEAYLVSDKSVDHIPRASKLTVAHRIIDSVCSELRGSGRCVRSSQ